MLAHGLFAAIVVFFDQHLNGSLGLPASIVGFSRIILVQLMTDVFLDPQPLNRRWSYARTPALSHYHPYQLNDI